MEFYKKVCDKYKFVEAKMSKYISINRFKQLLSSFCMTC